MGSSGKALCRSMVASSRAAGSPCALRHVLAADQEGLGAGAGHDAVEEVDGIGDARAPTYTRRGSTASSSGHAGRKARWRAGRRRSCRNPRAWRRSASCSCGRSGRSSHWGHPSRRDRRHPGRSARRSTACAGRNRPGWCRPATQTTNSASPHCTARAARRRATTPLAPPSGTWSSQRGLKPEMLGEADRGVGADGEARQRQAVDVGAAQAGTLDHLAHGAADPPVRGVGRIAPVRDGDRCGDDDAVVGLSPGSGAHWFTHPTSP